MSFLNGPVFFFILAALGLAGQFLDCYTTDIGIAHGFKESNKYAVWLIGKIGYAGLYILKCAGFGIAFPALFVILGQHFGVGYIVGDVLAAITAVAGFAAFFINYKRLKAAHVQVF